MQSAAVLEHQREWFRRQIFGRKSERFAPEPDPYQMHLCEFPDHLRTTNLQLMRRLWCFRFTFAMLRGAAQLGCPVFSIRHDRRITVF
jgi:hypothetical protein